MSNHITFVSLQYRFKFPPNIEAAEIERQTALIASHDCAALARFIEQLTAMIESGAELPEEIHAGALLAGFNVLGRLMAGIADQAIGSLESLREILDEGPRGAGEAFNQKEQGSPIPEDVLELAGMLAARGAAA